MQSNPKANATYSTSVRSTSVEPKKVQNNYFPNAPSSSSRIGHISPTCNELTNVENTKTNWLSENCVVVANWLVLVVVGVVDSVIFPDTISLLLKYCQIWGKTMTGDWKGPGIKCLRISRKINRLISSERLDRL